MNAEAGRGLKKSSWWRNVVLAGLGLELWVGVSIYLVSRAHRQAENASAQLHRLTASDPGLETSMLQVQASVDLARTVLLVAGVGTIVGLAILGSLLARRNRAED